MLDGAHVREHAGVGVGHGPADRLEWIARWRVEKREGIYVAGVGLERETPYETLEVEGNLLVYGGASALWERLIGTGVAAFSNALAQIGVGDSSAAEAATQTDLQASTNKTWKAMDATYPSHTDGTVIGSRDIIFQSTFIDTDANYAWAEFGIRVSTGTRLLNRKVQALGTKTTGSWTLTCTLTLA